MRYRIMLAAVAAVSLLAIAPVQAHEDVKQGSVDLEIGWATEPPIAGAPNAVFVGASRGGAPVRGLKLSVVVGFGEQIEDKKALEPDDEAPGTYLAAIIPTRPGVYRFRLTGTIDGKTIDKTFTAGPKTFDEVELASELQFPAKDPSAGELAEGVKRVGARVDERVAEARRLDDQASQTRTIALAGLALAVMALLLALTRSRTAKAVGA